MGSDEVHFAVFMNPNFNDLNSACEPARTHVCTYVCVGGWVFVFVCISIFQHQTEVEWWNHILEGTDSSILHTVKPVYNDHLSNKIYHLWFIQ